MKDTFGPVATNAPTKYELLAAARQAAYRQFARATGAKNHDAAAAAWDWVAEFEAMALGAWAIKRSEVKP